jgi:hypothetical protein
MKLRGLCLTLSLVLLATALPLSASQWIQLPFDQIVRESTYVVRGTVTNVYSAWNDDHDIIFSYATIRVQRYIGDNAGPATLIVREVGGTVGEYTQQAIGFPELREGEEVVLMLAKWDDSDDWRIHAYNQGKYLVRTFNGVEQLVEDPVKQGDDRLAGSHGPRMQTTSDMTMREFEQMVGAAREGRGLTPNHRQ